MNLEFESLIGLAALPVVVLVFTEHMKQLVRAIHNRNLWSDDTATPWPLVADIVGIVFAVLSWQAGYIPAVDSYLSASLVGLAASLVTQRGYKLVAQSDDSN